MRSLKFAIALVVGSLATSALAQQTTDFPVGELQNYRLDSGVQANPAPAAQTVFEELIVIEEAAWLRVYFARVRLEAGSFIRITSLLDMEVQELDAEAMDMWSNSSAYFNGSVLHVELVAAPGTSKNRFVIDEVAMEAAVVHPEGTCGICGADDRVPSDEDWSCRLFPAGCSASVWNEQSCIVSAGHCVSGGMVIQFRVPDSLGNCNTVNPPIADQFPIIQVLFSNGGVGNDWSAMISGTNNLGQKPYDRYGEFRPIATAPPVPGQALDIWGYGIDSQCTRSQTQQTSGGTVTHHFPDLFQHNVDATFGNSGSGVIRNGEILGIATHCPCNNIATRVDLASFAAARDQLCAETTESLPFDFNAFRGFHASGNFNSLLASDDNKLCYKPGITLDPSEAPVTLDFFGTLPNDSPASVKVTIESTGNTGGLGLAVSFWNFNTNSWDEVGTAGQSFNNDVERTFAGNPANHVEPGTGEVRTRYEVRQVGFIFLFPWADCIDHVFWLTTE